jgi:hypothetical protein
MKYEDQRTFTGGNIMLAVRPFHHQFLQFLHARQFPWHAPRLRGAEWSSTRQCPPVMCSRRPGPGFPPVRRGQVVAGAGQPAVGADSANFA